VSWIVEVEVGMDESAVAEARDFYTRAIAELVTLDRVSTLTSGAKSAEVPFSSP